MIDLIDLIDEQPRVAHKEEDADLEGMLKKALEVLDEVIKSKGGNLVIKNAV